MQNTLLKKESNVIMNSSNEENLKKTYEEFESPLNAFYLAGDISKRETGQKLVALALEKFDSVDVLINNAGPFTEQNRRSK
ncbi:SDR family NAD(P)-dependent oxidoreductase [Aquimarina macrocephali]|uniref:SDR family NAD(P)-dependent oxidoreductase n=1 Tax=Aquimarina macrocephali TaxID=666563 RepID=UPI003F67FCA6